MNQSNNQNNTFFQYSLHNVENYKEKMNYSIGEVASKQSLLIVEYLKFISEKVNFKNTECNKFIIIRGLKTVCHVFNQILYYSKNMDLAFYHGQKAFYFYVEFIEQISEDQHSFLQLNSRDATMFVYKKTIFDINNDLRKNVNNIENMELFDILYIHTNIVQTFITFLIHNYDFCFDKEKNTDSETEQIKEDKKTFINEIIFKTETIVGKITSSISNKNSYNVLLIFIEKMNKLVNVDKYYEIMIHFLKKYQKGKLTEFKVMEKIHNPDFNKMLEEETSEKFIAWLLA